MCLVCIVTHNHSYISTAATYVVMVMCDNVHVGCHNLMKTHHICLCTLFTTPIIHLSEFYEIFLLNLSVLLCRKDWQGIGFGGLVDDKTTN